MAAVICGRNIWKKGEVGLGPQLAGEADALDRAGADAVEHEGLALDGSARDRSRRSRECGGRAAGTLAAADAGMGHVVAQARLEHAEAFGHLHCPAIAIRQSVIDAMAAFVQCAHACDQGQPTQAEIAADQEIIGIWSSTCLLSRRSNLFPAEILRAIPSRRCRSTTVRPP